MLIVVDMVCKPMLPLFGLLLATSSIGAMALPVGWSHVGRTSGAEVLRLSFALKQQNLGELERTFWAVSDPQSPSYGQFKTFNEIKALVAPLQESVNEVLAFFRNDGLSPVLNPGGDYVVVELSAEQASAILKADIQAYQHNKTNLVHHRALDGFTLPAALSEHVDHVFPLVMLPMTLKKRPSKTVELIPDTARSANANDDSSWPRDCAGLTKDGMITPGVLRQRYNVTLPTTARKGSIAVALPYDPDDGCGFIQSDIVERNKLCGLGAAVSVEVKGDGKSKYCPQTCAKKVGDSCGESNLDVMTITGLADGIRSEFWIIASGDPLDVFKQFNEDSESALVLSCSFGDSEADFDDDGGKRLETELQKAGVAGKTVVFASGDNGVWLPADSAVQAGSPRRRSHSKFSVGYPQSSVYVTAVGGSQFVPRSGGDRGGDVIGEEMGVQTGLDQGSTWVTSGSSGGGISNMFKAPTYQASFVSKWYDSAKSAGTLPASSKWANTNANRGYPDLAVLAGLPGEGKATKDGTCTGECASYYLRQAGYWTHEDGTSASSPAFAAMVAVINEHRLAAGQPSMGAINTFLYQNVDAFADITKGDNKYFADSKGYGGFLATTGWDPVTGLGAPNVAKLTQAALNAAQNAVVV